MYRGRLAPSPTGYLHLGHARTFWTAQERAGQARGLLVLRIEDLDRQRSNARYAEALIEDLRWFGLAWQEGPDTGGPAGPYLQSARRPSHQAAFEALRQNGFLYPCACSRKDVWQALGAPHAQDDELIYPGTCRAGLPSNRGKQESRISWRFRVSDGETIAFNDGRAGPQQFMGGRDFGDFVVWGRDDLPAYQLAVVADDAAMGITEVVRGADLLLSTARQLLLYRALGLVPPAFYHCPLMTDGAGARLAKRHESLSLRALRERGLTPEQLRETW